MHRVGQVRDAQDAARYRANTNNVVAGNYALYLEIEVDLTAMISGLLFTAPSAAPIYVLDAPFDGTVPTAVQKNLNIFTG